MEEVVAVLLLEMDDVQAVHMLLLFCLIANAKPLTYAWPACRWRRGRRRAPCLKICPPLACKSDSAAGSRCLSAAPPLDPPLSQS